MENKQIRNTFYLQFLLHFTSSSTLFKPKPASIQNENLCQIELISDFKSVIFYFSQSTKQCGFNLLKTFEENYLLTGL